MTVNNYGGRLGRIIKKHPKVPCKECDTYQVQITSYLKGDPQYRCRRCKHTFSLPFEDSGKDDVEAAIDKLMKNIKE